MIRRYVMRITKNSYHTIDITHLSHTGQGLGMLDNLPVIVEQALPGERVEIKLIKLAQSYAVGKLITIIRSSPDRVQPFCDVFRRCGGCSLQHFTYAAQLRAKTAWVKETITTERDYLANVIIHPAIGMDIPRHYRNKAQYPIGQQHGRVALGFYAKRSHAIIEHDICDIQPARMNTIRAVVSEFLETHHISIYDEAQHAGLVRHLMIRAGMRTGEYMVVLVINGHDLPHKSLFINRLLNVIPEIASIILNVNQQDTNVILDDTNRVICGNECITDILGDHTFTISPRSFYQINPVQAEALYRTVLEYAGLHGPEIVVDLFCGIGTISLFLAPHAKMVYGIDIVEDAIHDARNNAAVNGVENAEFLQGEVAQILPLLIEQGITPDVVVVDPPRKGCDAKLLETLIQMRPTRMVYVSCHPKTLVRDLCFLAENGFNVTEIQPVDMFPHTTHVECVAKIVHCPENF